MDNHPLDCNCEDCWWSRGQREICPTCGCFVGQGCPCSNDEETKKPLKNSIEN